MLERKHCAVIALCVLLWSASVTHCVSGLLAASAATASVCAVLGWHFLQAARAEEGIKEQQQVVTRSSLRLSLPHLSLP